MFAHQRGNILELLPVHRDVWVCDNGEDLILGESLLKGNNCGLLIAFWA